MQDGQSVALAYGDPVGDAGVFEVLLRDACVLGQEFEREDVTILGQAVCEPDGAVSAECSDFEDVARRDGSSEQHELFALHGGDMDVGQLFSFAILQDIIERCAERVVIVQL